MATNLVVRPGAIKLLEPAFDVGHLDGFADATNNNPCDPAQRFQSWHKRRPVEEFADYERGYRASYQQVVRDMQEQP